MSRRQILTDEVNGDPLGRGYAGMTDQQVADDIDAGREDPAQAYRSMNQPVGIAELELAIRESLKWSEYRERQMARLEVTVENQGINTLINPAMAEFMDLFFTTSSSGGVSGVDGGGQIDLQGTYMDGLIDRMVAEGSMGVAVAEQLRDYGIRPISRGEEIGAPNPTSGEISEVRA